MSDAPAKDRAACRAVAVTGASGFIGSHLCMRLSRLGWETRALVRDPSRFVPPAPGVRAFVCDLPDRLDPAGLEGAEVVVHCAYMTRFTDEAQARKVNDLGTRRILEAGRSTGVARFVFLSSQSAHEGARSYYGRSKLGLERLFDVERDVVIRSGLVLGMEAAGLFRRMVDMVRRSRIIPLFGGGRQPLQTVHVDDLCAAIESSMARGLSGHFTVAHPRPVEMGAFLRGIARRLGRRPLFVPFPMAPALLVLRAIERLRVPFPISSENLLGLECLRAADTGPDLARLGVKPRDTEECLDEVLA